MGRWTRVALVLLALPLLAGCPLLRLLGFPVGNKVPYSPKESEAVSDTGVRKDVQFEDIPDPIGFVLRRDKVFSFRGHSFRFGKFVYEGAWTMRKTRAFYREQMPVCGWTYVKTEEQGPYAERQFYSKGREGCSVEITSAVDGITVVVRVYDSRDENAPALR